MWVHRVLLATLGVLIAVRIGLDISFVDLTFPVGLLLTLALFATYVGLAFAAQRVAEEAEIDFTPIPLLAIYLLTGIGPFVSIWLDRKASRRIEECGAAPGFAHLTRDSAVS